jgi:putative transposase
MARKKKFSRNWRKAKARITRLHTKIANIRKDYLHQVSNELSKNHVVAVIEDLEARSIQ